MSIKWNRDGSATFLSDADGVTTQQATGTTAQIDAAYITFQNSWPLAYWQGLWAANLKSGFEANFNLVTFIENGTVSNLTAAQVGTFLATIANNYRSLRAQIAAATTVAQVQAININSGWPSNP